MGADYKTQTKQVICGMERAGLLANVTTYVNPTGGDDFNNPILVHSPFPIAGTLDRLYYQTSLAPGAGETFTMTVFVNGIAVGVTCQIAAAAVEATDLVNTAEIVAGDDVCLRIVTSAGAVACNHKWAFNFRPH